MHVKVHPDLFLSSHTCAVIIMDYCDYGSLVRPILKVGVLAWEGRRVGLQERVVPFVAMGHV